LFSLAAGTFGNTDETDVVVVDIIALFLLLLFTISLAIRGYCFLNGSNICDW
jgi:hypothetical protein